MSLIEEFEFQSFGQLLGIERVGSDGEHTPSGIVSSELTDCLATTQQFTGNVQCASFCVMSLEGYTSFHITYQIAPLWVKVDEQAVLDGRSDGSRGFG